VWLEHRRERRRRDQVAAAELDGVEAELGRGTIDETLADERSLGDARRAERARRCLVRQHGLRLELEALPRIRPDELRECDQREKHALRADVRADVDPDPVAQREQRPVRADCELDLVHLLTGMVRGHEVLVAVLDPLDRPPVAEREERDQEVFRVELPAHAEPAADVALDEQDLLGRQAEQLREDVAVEVLHLRRAVHEEPSVRVGLGEEAARLERRPGVARHP